MYIESCQSNSPSFSLVNLVPTSHSRSLALSSAFNQIIGSGKGDFVQPLMMRSISLGRRGQYCEAVQDAEKALKSKKSLEVSHLCFSCNEDDMHLSFYRS